MVNKLLTLILVMTLISMVNFGYSAKAKVAFLKGSGKLIRGADSYNLSKGMEVERGDIIIVHKSSSALIKLPTATLKIGERSKVTIRFSNDTTNARLESGSVVANVKKLNAQDFKVSGVSGVAGVRGTSFKLDTRAEDTAIEVKEGNVKFERKNSFNPTYVVAGDKAVVHESESKVRIIPKKKIEKERRDYPVYLERLIRGTERVKY